MQVNRISIESIDDGLDRKHLHDLKRRFGQVNTERLKRTRSALAQRQRIFLDLLPLLFHTNHPMLPGYVSRRTPAGVFGYRPDIEDLRLAQALARSFRLNREPHQHCHILALFLMGSVGTVAHSESSDLDIWVCHQPGLGRAELTNLDCKCTKLTQWARQLGLEAHFFLMDCERFQRGGVVSFDSEGSGSAQHYLLLDEFYRTGLLLAGRAPLWWFTPAGRETDYREYTRKLLDKRFLESTQVLDFGGVAHIPDGEFIGAGVWQLYKGIESPYKAVLKLMLLECYASEYPNITPLALSFKEAVYSGWLNVNELDPYVMVYRRLEHYLLERREPRRLELLRRCFYFKVNKPLTRASGGRQKSWQRQLLESLVAEWGWDKTQLARLDARPHWKAQQVIAEHRLLVNELTNGYRFLMDFARLTHASAAIRADELNVLGRKLHAAFERRAGKIDWINPHISPDLSEAFITLVLDNSVLKAAEFESNTVASSANSIFSAYAQPLSDTPYQNRHMLKRSRNLIELLVWCHCNGILTPRTRCELAPTAVETSLSAVALRLTIQIIRRWLPLPMAQVTHEDFQQQACTRAALLLINVGADPQYRLQQQGIYRITDHMDPLGFSGMKDSLVASIAMVTVNSWNEVSTHHFGQQPLVSCLRYYLRLFPAPGRLQTEALPGSRLDVASLRGSSLPELAVHCVSASRAAAIGQRVEELFRDILACYYSGDKPPSTRYVFEVAGSYYCLQFADNEPHISHESTSEGLLDHLGRAQPDYSPIVIDRSALKGHPLRIIAETATDAAIQVFYQTRAEDRADVYVVDEKGSILKMSTPFLDHQTLLRPLHRFIRAVIQRQSIESNQPQQSLGIHPVDFYELKANAKGVTHCERRRVNTELDRLFFFNIQVIADLAESEAAGEKSDGCLEPNYRIYCDQQEFSEMELGAELFATVARYILSRRRKAERYPCYITDLDLSQCRPRLAPRSGLQINHYLSIKARLEQRLNAALQAL